MAKNETNAKPEGAKPGRVKVGGVQGWKWDDGPCTGRFVDVSHRKTRFGERLAVTVELPDGEKTILYLPPSHEAEATKRVGRVVTVEREGSGFNTAYYYTNA